MSARARRSRLLAPSFLVVAAFSACGEDVDSSCPAEKPASESACRGDLECEYDGGCSHTVCSEGLWYDIGGGCNPPRPVPCPEQPPTSGDECNEDWNEYPERCDYVVPGCGEVVALCNYDDGTWDIMGGCADGAGGAGGVGGDDS